MTRLNLGCGRVQFMRVTMEAVKPARPPERSLRQTLPLNFMLVES